MQSSVKKEKKKDLILSVIYRESSELNRHVFVFLVADGESTNKKVNLTLGEKHSRWSLVRAVQSLC